MQLAYTLNVRPAKRLPRAHNLDAESSGPETLLSVCVTWSPQLRLDDVLRRAHYNLLIRFIGWQKHNHTDDLISYIYKPL